MSKEISERMVKIIENRKWTWAVVGEKMGMTRQGAHFILHTKEDKNWSEWEIEGWCKRLRIDVDKIMAIKKRIEKEESGCGVHYEKEND